MTSIDSPIITAKVDNQEIMETTPLSLLTYTDLKKKIDNFEDELDLFSEFIFDPDYN